MRSILFCLLVLLGMALGEFMTPEALAQGKVHKLGHVAIDKYEATIEYEDCYQWDELYRVTISLRKPAKAPAIDAKRIQVWLLATKESEKPTIALHSGPTGTLPEEGAGEQVAARGVYFFHTGPVGGQPAAVVVAVDGEPKAFQVPPPWTGSGIDAKTIGAWKNAGGEFLWYYLSEDSDPSEQFYGTPKDPAALLPCFSFSGKVNWAAAQALPVPKVPFGILVYDQPEGVLTKVPGRSKAVGLGLIGKSLSQADWKELATLTQLRTLELGCDVEEEYLKSIAALTNLERLSLKKAGVGGESLKELAALKKLRTLGTHAAGQRLKDLTALPNLRTLDLSRTTLSNADLATIAAFANLETLNLSHTNVTGAGCKALAGHKNLRHLNLYGTTFDEQGFQYLAGLPKLQLLRLTDVQINGLGLKQLAGLGELHELYLNSTKLEDAGCLELAKLTKLRVLHLDHTLVTDKGMKGLTGLKELRELSLESIKIGDAGCQELAGLTELQRLSLFQTKIGDAGLKALAGLTKLQELNLRYCPVTLTGLKALAGLKQLRTLDLRDVANKTTALEMQKALPWTFVAW